MDLRAAILGLLSWKPASGYDLKRIISDSDIFYWSGNNNQIYKSLIELQREGLVEYQVLLQESLPAKKVYSITAAGLAELRHSLLAEPQAPLLHKSFLVQLAWAESLTDEEVLGLLKRYEAEMADRLRLYLGQAARGKDRPDRSPRERYLWTRITENLIGSCQSELDWVRQTQAAFTAGGFSLYLGTGVGQDEHEH